MVQRPYLDSCEEELPAFEIMIEEAVPATMKFFLFAIYGVWLF